MTRVGYCLLMTVFSLALLSSACCQASAADARQPEGAALFVHLLDRYANDAPNKTEVDER